MAVSAAWREFDDELARWRDAGRAVDFWWRDDDAGRAHPALARLLDLARRSGVPLGLAVIPGDAEAGVLADLSPSVAVLQHGCDHDNRALAGGKKSEFPDSEAQNAALARLAEARRKLLAISGGRALPVLVPPWNRMHEALVARLPEAGYAGLSRFGARAAPSVVTALRQVNTHVDLIDWKGSRGFAGEELVLGRAVRHLCARREGRADPGEPTGWLSHHRVHDAATWDFLARLFDATQRRPGLRWRHPAELFAAM